MYRWVQYSTTNLGYIMYLWVHYNQSKIDYVQVSTVQYIKNFSNEISDLIPKT